MKCATKSGSGENYGARNRNRTGTTDGREILSLLRLPISPPGLDVRRLCDTTLRNRMNAGNAMIGDLLMEAGVGIEPAYAELQSAA